MRGNVGAYGSVRLYLGMYPRICWVAEESTVLAKHGIGDLARNCCCIPIESGVSRTAGMREGRLKRLVAK